MKYRKFIIVIIVAILIILPKFLVKPINNGVVKKENEILASESGKQWLYEMDAKIAPIEKILNGNNIQFEIKENDTAKGIVSNTVNEPLKDFRFTMIFNIGIQGTKSEKEKSEISRINFTLKNGENLNISKIPLVINLMNEVSGQDSYNYNKLDNEINEAISKLEVVNEYKTFESKVGEFKEKIQIYKDEKDEIKFEWTAERKY